MLFNFALFSSLLLASAVLAEVPSALGASVARRSERRQSQPDSCTASDSIYNLDGVLAGASLSKDEALGWVTGTFAIPTISGPPGASLAVWVGLDALGCENSTALLAGVKFTVASSGQPEYSAFFGSPADGQPASNIAISAGDIIRLSVFTHNLEATIENLTSGHGENMIRDRLYPQSAQWMIQDLTLDLSLADFGTITIYDALAGEGGVGIYDPSGSDVTFFDMNLNNQVVTSVSVYRSILTIRK